MQNELPGVSVYVPLSQGKHVSPRDDVMFGQIVHFPLTIPSPG